MTRRYLHPDTLYDEPYEAVPLDLGSFRPVVTDVSPWWRDSRLQ
jgi:hypothetical protein